jgi:hypothetical protein|tara:strand:+ start:249 stop:1382 length:1134 start_codon:yes stop_codon:yes gene_type:complete
MKKKKKIKKNKKKYKKRVKIKKPNKKKIFRKKSIKRKQRVKNRAKKPKKPKKLKLEIPESFKVIKKFTLKNLFSYISAPVFEAYYNFQRDRKRKLLKAQEAKDREIERRKRERLELVKKMKEEQVKEELYYSKELKKDMQIFLNEQAREARKIKAKQQQEIINNLKLSKQAAAFEARQNKEIVELEKVAYKTERDDYQEVLDRIAAIRLKYKNLRLESYRKKLEELGIEVQGDEDRTALLEKEKKLLLQKSEIENTLMPFTRSLRSIAFFCNRSKILGKHLSPLKIIDQSDSTGEIYLKWLELSESSDFLLLCFLKDNNIETKKIVLEIKTNPEKHLSVEFDIKSIFQFQETAIDAVVKLIDRERNSKKTQEQKQAS